jgi:hypothetical protein
MKTMRLTIPEILKLVSNAKTHQEKVNILRQNASEPLEQILQYNFHPDIKFSLPEGPAPYKKEGDLPEGMSHSNLYKEGRRLYLFLEGHAPNLKPFKKETLFIELLEGIHWTEADMLIAVKDKLLDTLYPGVTYECARDAFARLLPADAPKKVAKPVVEAKAQVTPVDGPLELLVDPPATTTVNLPSASKKGFQIKYTSDEERKAARAATVARSKAKAKAAKKAAKAE